MINVHLFVLWSLFMTVVDTITRISLPKDARDDGTTSGFPPVNWLLIITHYVMRCSCQRRFSNVQTIICHPREQIQPSLRSSLLDILSQGCKPCPPRILTPSRSCWEIVILTQKLCEIHREKVWQRYTQRCYYILCRTFKQGFRLIKTLSCDAEYQGLILGFLHTASIMASQVDEMSCALRRSTVVSPSLEYRVLIK